MFETTAKPLIGRFVEGFNCTILAYGQTSSGKTFTMTGVDLDADPSDPSSNMGIIPRAVSNVFTRANQLKDEKAGAWTYNIKASFIEIYNEDLIDLLTVDDISGKREVLIREDKHGHIIWDGLREVNVRNANEVMGYVNTLYLLDSRLSGMLFQSITQGQFHSADQRNGYECAILSFPCHLLPYFNTEEILWVHCASSFPFTPASWRSLTIQARTARLHVRKSWRCQQGGIPTSRPPIHTQLCICHEPGRSSPRKRPWTFRRQVSWG